jgi:GrpB-like predicted nucleotidyltransferase (UPF0157 family)
MGDTEHEADVVVIVDYDPSWESLYEVSAAEIRDVLGPWVVDVAHIGSTSVPGLAAKPIIDMQVSVNDLSATPAIVDALRQAGYEYVPEFETEMPFRRYFRRTTNGRRTHHIHLVERSNTEWWDRHIAFRDWLRSHPEDCERYAALKRTLAAEHRQDPAAYTDAKSPFVKSIEARARAAAE